MNPLLPPSAPLTPGAPGPEIAVVGSLDEILMVEDSPTDAELALRAFKLAAFANPVVVATSGEAGLDYLLGTGAYAARGPTRPRMILLDLNLPKMSGVDFLHRVRAEGRTRDIPVIILSLSERDRDVTACIHLGAEAYLVKPVNFENFARIATGLKVRLTLVERPRHGRSSGWVLSGSPAAVEARPAAGPAVPGADH